MLAITDVKKYFSTKRALDGVSLNISDGTIYGLLGPNGAGKTTLIRIMTGITMPDSGEANFNGSPIMLNLARQIGYLPEERGLYKKSQVGDQIVYFARLHGMSEQDARREMMQWLKRFDIVSWKNKKIEELSKGMAQKVQFITTVIHRPQLLILDEPFSGFDPINAEAVRQEILRLNSEGTTVVLSTHNMESVETLCKEISLINNGKIVLQGKVSDIKQRFKEDKYDVRYRTPDGEEISEVMHRHADENNNQFLQRIAEKGEVLEFREQLPSMNDIFINVVNANERE